MNVPHGDHEHVVYLMDDGTLDTVIQVDGHEVRFEEADRWPKSGAVKDAWLARAARGACDDGLLDDDEEEES